MAKPFTWKELSMKQIYDYQSTRVSQNSLKYLQGIFKLENNEKDEILLDLYCHSLSFTKEIGFAAKQTSAFLFILKELHKEVVSSSLVNMEKDYAYFKHLLMQHAIHRPPFSEKIFSLSEVKTISEYITHTYFRHYLMYKYVFTKKLRMNLIVENFMSNHDDIKESTEQDTVDDKLSDNQTAYQAAYDAEKCDDAESSKDARLEISGSITKLAREEITSTDASKPSDTAMMSDHSPATISKDISHGSTLGQHPYALQTCTAHTISAGMPSKDITKHDETNGFEKSSEFIVSDVSKSVASGKQEAAIIELKSFISSVLATKLDDMRSTLLTKLTAQEEHINAKLKKIEGNLEDDKKKDLKVKSKK
ncbi:hypothetical protein BDV3_000307 [Batrachochytrium dendrobatidis]|nr:hypothetical protein QVD99_000068 [Batrachochytrium dendrobatidis]KAK5667908.1 hypothetical protein QVD99_004960 [Batrachochytrium dendrobatidis]